MCWIWLCGAHPPRKLESSLPTLPLEVVQFLSRFAAGGTPAGQRGQRSWHGDTSTQRKQVGFDGMTQTHLLALRACIFGSSERKHASQRCPYQLHDLRSSAGG